FWSLLIVICLSLFRSERGPRRRTFGRASRRGIATWISMRDFALFVAPALVESCKTCWVLRDVSNFLHDSSGVNFIISIVPAVIDPSSAGDHLVLTVNSAAALQRIGRVTIFCSSPGFRDQDENDRRGQYLNHLAYELGEPVLLAP